MNGSGVAGQIRRRLSELSPNDHRIARQILDDDVEAPFETAESLAAKTGVSKAAVVRFSTRVGYTGFAALHDALAAEAIARLRPAVRTVEAASHTVEQMVSQAVGDLEMLATPWIAASSMPRSRCSAAGPARSASSGTASRRPWRSTPTTS